MAAPLRRFKRRCNFDAMCIATLSSLSLTLSLSFFVFNAPYAIAGKNSPATTEIHSLDKKFKGRLPITELTEDEAIMHALNRLAYGPRPGDVERIRETGLEKWIEQQLDPGSMDDVALDKRLEKYPTLKMSSRELLEEFPRPNQAAKQQGMTPQEYKQEMQDKRKDAAVVAMLSGNDNGDRAAQQLGMVQGPNKILAELSMAKLDRAIYSDRQLEAVMEDFWFNHFNVFANKGDDKWLLTPYVRDSIRPHTMGKFDDLLVATAKSPAMLFYLDNWLSADPQANEESRAEAQARRRYRGPFGGFPPYPRFPVPPNQPPNNGQQQAKPKQERGLNENYGREVMELHTVGVDAGYSQQDVIEMAKTLTGWTIHEPRINPEFFFDEKIHTRGKKTVMGHTFNSGGMKDGEEALKMLANDPHTARFISTELAKHFVSENPPKALIDRMAKDYESSGGNIRDVLKAMIYSPEFWSREAYRSKVKTPFELVASTARALNADVPVSFPLTQWVSRIGEPLFLCQPPTGYSDKAETWVNSGALLTRLNFATTFASGRLAGTTVDLNAMFGEESAGDAEAALSRAVNIFLGDQVSPETRQTLEMRLNDPQILQARLDDPVKHVNEGLISGLVLGAPEFQRR